MDIFGGILTAPGVQPALWALGVKIGVDRLRALFKTVDEQGVPQSYKGPLHILVAVATAIATIASLALDGKLSTYPIQDAVNFLTLAVPMWLAALGWHAAGNQVLDNKTLVEAIKDKTAPK